MLHDRTFVAFRLKCQGAALLSSSSRPILEQEIRLVTQQAVRVPLQDHALLLPEVYELIRHVMVAFTIVLHVFEVRGYLLLLMRQLSSRKKFLRNANADLNPPSGLCERRGRTRANNFGSVADPQAINADFLNGLLLPLCGERSKSDHY